jgi:hypothetical protein
MLPWHNALLAEEGDPCPYLALFPDWFLDQLPRPNGILNS